jgi:hypothetical protein
MSHPQTLIRLEEEEEEKEQAFKGLRMLFA